MWSIAAGPMLTFSAQAGRQLMIEACSVVVMVSSHTTVSVTVQLGRYRAGHRLTSRLVHRPGLPLTSERSQVRTLPRPLRPLSVERTQAAVVVATASQGVAVAGLGKAGRR